MNTINKILAEMHAKMDELSDTQLVANFVALKAKANRTWEETLVARIMTNEIVHRGLLGNICG